MEVLIIEGIFMLYVTVGLHTCCISNDKYCYVCVFNHSAPYFQQSYAKAYLWIVLFGAIILPASVLILLCTNKFGTFRHLNG